MGTDGNNDPIENVGNAADPWKIRASLKKGPSGAEALGELDVPIIDGFANFTGLYLSLEGTGYQLEFKILYPYDLTLPPVESIEFDMGPRPLGVKFDTLDLFIPNADTLNVTFNIWDLGVDVLATSDVLGTQTWTCDLTFSINIPVTIVGSTTSSITQAGGTTGLFSVSFKGSALNAVLVTTCQSPETGRSITGSSNSFTLFPGSSDDTGLLRQTTLALLYNGPYTAIESVVDAFNSELGSLECDGCPSNPATSSRRRRNIASDMVNTKEMQFCSMPIKHKPGGC